MPEDVAQPCRFEMRSVADLLSLFPDNGQGKKVLDLDVGSGIRATLLSDMNYRVSAVGYAPPDEVASIVKYLDKKHVRYEVCSPGIESMPFGEGAFDWVVLTRIPPGCSVNHLLSEVNRVMKRGAALLIQAPNSSSASRGDVLAERLSTLRSLGAIRRTTEAEYESISIMNRVLGSLDRYGFQRILRTFRDSGEIHGRSAIRGAKRVVRLLFPRLRDTIYIVCRKR
jgi:ubiquinone/menaquinone biosynthesis C-methylase UbiE